jgi:hypothetical protein
VLALSNGLGRALRDHLHDAHQHVSHCMVGSSDNALLKSPAEAIRASRRS